MADNFSVWLAKPRRHWVVQDSRVHNGWRILRDDPMPTPESPPQRVAKGFQEPAEAADVAEEVLTKFGVPGVSYAELRLNGDTEPHTVIFYMEEDLFGVWNTDVARWPIFYAENNPYGMMLDGYPEGFVPYGEDGTPEDENSDGFGKTDEDSKLMDLSNDGTEDDDEADDEDENREDEPEEEDGTESEDEDDDEQDEGDSDEDDDEDGLDGDGENETDQEEDEMELPRLRLFAKMRGPLGWRKRAELEDLNERNMFSLKVGVLDPDEDKTAAQREKNVIVQVDFIETDDDHANGTLRMRLPKGVSLDDFKQTGGDWIVVNVPLPHEEN